MDRPRQIFFKFPPNAEQFQFVAPILFLKSHVKWHKPALSWGASAPFLRGLCIIEKECDFPTFQEAHKSIMKLWNSQLDDYDR